MDRIPSQAFILAAGMGTRLKPHTDRLPKPMVSVAGKPIIDHILDKLVGAGVENCVINLHHLGSILESHLQRREKPRILFSRENDLLETGGGVKNALPLMEESPFYLINGDAFWTEDSGKSPSGVFHRLAQRFNPEIMDILLLLQPVAQMTLTAGVGDYTILEDGQARRSPGKSGEHMFAGIRIVHPRVFAGAPDGPFSFLQLMDKAEKEHRLYGLIHTGAWHHISTAKDLSEVNRAIADQENGS